MRILILLVSVCVMLPAAGWMDTERQQRLIVAVPANTHDTLVQIPTSALPGFEKAAPASIRIYDADASAPTAIRPIFEGGYLFWPTAAAKTYHIYYALAVHPYTGAAWDGKTATDAMVSVPDYAKAAYGKSWDFDDGGTANIHAWGNAPENIQNKTVNDGILSFDAVGDPWFTWGDMFGGGPKENIDTARYTTLLMRVRQSVDAAPWQVFCLSDKAGIQKYEFIVRGKDWQIIRIHLSRDANFKGVLRSIRIDPTDKLNSPAHVEIDWVRLLPAVDATVGAAATRYNSTEPTAVSLAVMDGIAGEAVPLQIQVQDAQKKPVAYADVRITLRHAGTKRSFIYNSISRQDGSASLVITNTLAGSYSVRAASSLQPSVEAVRDMKLSPAAREIVRISLSGRGTWHPADGKWVMCVREGESFPILPRIADRFGNTVAENGSFTWLDAGGGTLSGGTEFRNGIASASYRAAASGEIQPQFASLTSERIFVHVSPRRTKKNAITLLKNGYYGYSDGSVFLPLGGHYANWPLKPPDFKGNFDLFPCNPKPFLAAVPFDEKTRGDLTQWFSQLSNNGVNTLRLMLRNMDLIGKVDESQLAAVKEYMEIARGFGIHFIVVLLEDYKKPPYVNREIIEKIVLPHFPDTSFDDHPAYRKRFFVDKNIAPMRYVDADARRCKREYLAELIPHLVDVPNILTYELENEMLGAPASWINEMTAAIKAVDPVTPVSASTGGGGLLSGDPYFFTRATAVDLYTYHQYPTQSEKTRADAHAATLADDDIELGNFINTLTRYGRACNKPAFLGESGWFDNFFKSGDTPQYLLRDIVWLALVNDPGHCFWLFGGNESSVYRPVKEIMSRLDLATFRRDKADAVVDASHNVGADYYYYQSNRADYYALLAHNRRALDAGAHFDFSLSGRSGTPLAEKALPTGKQYVRVGKGYQAAMAFGNNYERILIYARNYSGTEILKRNDATRGFGVARTRASAELSISFSLPHASYTRWVYDLEGDVREEEAAGTSELTVPASDHDYVIVLRKK
ncbi:MAG: hypothetical protein AABZ39_15555 [Spirochaetota bacterium]